MANKPMKRKPLVTWEMQIKVTKRHHYTHNRMVKLKKKKLIIPIAGKKIQSNRNSCCRWGGRLGQPLGKAVWQFLPELNIVLPFHPAVMLLGIYPIKLKTLSPQKKVCT